MTFSPALVQRLFPARSLSRELMLLLAGVVVIAIGAWIEVPLQPVPITLQTFAVLLVGGLYGFRRGVAVVLAYAAAGACGAPVFAGGGHGLRVLAGPTGGYLLGFLFSAGTMGLLAEHGFLRTHARTVIAVTAATLPVFVFGLAWLSRYVPGEALLASGFFPFVPGAVLKALAAALLLPALHRLR